MRTGPPIAEAPSDPGGPGPGRPGVARPMELDGIRARLHARNLSFLDYYLKRLGHRSCLPRSEFDPVDVRALMGRLVIYQRRDPADFQIRLFGTKVAERLGYDATGRNLLDLVAYANKAEIAQVLNRMLDHGLGHYSRVRDRFASGREVRVEILRLPLLDAQGAPSLVITCTEELETLGFAARDDSVELVGEPLESRLFALNGDA